mmetsp:Transcript_20664/g.44855  ORF Transcript_20664/g.44855 Transcript_20664/m.44855 type:complete len:776 (+) Transcript_20664:74-2401(+)
MDLLYTNQTYTDELATFVREQFPLWTEENGANPIEKTIRSRTRRAKKASGRKTMLSPKSTFGRHYTDNFQLRSLAGCSSADCSIGDDDDDIHHDEATTTTQSRQLDIPIQNTINCTMYFVTSTKLFETCHKNRVKSQCPNGCDGPCSYPAAPPLGGPTALSSRHLTRAKRALASFDAVLLTDQLGEERQSDFLSDLFDTPRDARYSLKNHKEANAVVVKGERRDKVRFYRDLLMRLNLNGLYKKVREENELEIELYRYASELNEGMMERWEKEIAGGSGGLDEGEQSASLPGSREITLGDNSADSGGGENATAVDLEGEQTSRGSGESAPDENSANSGGGDEDSIEGEGDDRDGEVPTTTTTNRTNREHRNYKRQPLRISEKELEGSSIDEIAFQTGNNHSIDAHDYAVLIVHYHKTGYVLTRFLMKLTVKLEYAAAGKSNAEVKNAKKENEYFVDNLPVAFNQRGNWNKNYVHARRHSGVTECPTSFVLERGAIHLQEAPDFYCSDADLARGMVGRSGRAKMVHFVRNPFEMVLSNYFYHSQDPTPEKWVHIDDPCECNYGNGKSLASHVLPELSNRTKITDEHLDAVVTMCRSLYRSSPRMKNATFYDHLLELDHWKGLQLATAQMIIASSNANKGLAGGDILRMAQNTIKFQNLLTSPSIPDKQRENMHLLTVSMDDYIKDIRNVTLKFLDFVLGTNDTVVPRDMRIEKAEEQVEGAKKKKKTNVHITQGKHEDKDELKQLLRDDPVLGLILSEVEILVNDALTQSEDLVYR